MATTVSNLRIQRQSNEGEYFAAWDFAEDKAKSFEVKWYYWTGDGIKFCADDKDEATEVEQQVAFYSPPQAAFKFAVTVKPVPKTKKVKGKNKKTFTGEWSTEVEYQLKEFPFDTPDTPTANWIDEYRVQFESKVDNESPWPYEELRMEFAITRNHGDLNSTTYLVASINDNGYARCEYNVDSTEDSFSVKCRVFRVEDPETNKRYGNGGPWSSLLDNLRSGPAMPSNLRMSAVDRDHIQVYWDPAGGAKTYEVEWTEHMEYFDSGMDVGNMSSAEDQNFVIVDGVAGQKLWFRVRSVSENNSGRTGKSEWLYADVQAVTGVAPDPPSTWTLKTTYSDDEDVTFYWIHNSKDNSVMTSAMLYMQVGSVTFTRRLVVADDPSISNLDTDELLNHVWYVQVNRNMYPTMFKDSTQIRWWVTTIGGVDTPSDESVVRTVNIRSKPTLAVSTNLDNSSDEMKMLSFPLRTSMTANPVTQKAIRFFMKITSKDSYSSFNADGTRKTLIPGSVVYDGYRDANGSNTLNWDLSPGDVDLDPNIHYELRVDVATNSGLTASYTIPFVTAWVDEIYDVDAEMGYDEDTYTMSLRPILMKSGDEVTENVALMSVFRREYDGTFTQIARNIQNASNITVIDPYPALDEGRYRITAYDMKTGSMIYSDLPGYPIGEIGIIIQWNDDWSSYSTDSEDNTVDPDWNGSLLRLIYNIDTQSSYSKDVNFVEYIGRRSPVGYYGTQLGEGATWNTVIPADDIETIYGLRRLAVYQGDVYVREPSGVGYWAQIDVSFTKTHMEVTIPVTLTIKRVEGKSLVKDNGRSEVEDARYLTAQLNN